MNQRGGEHLAPPVDARLRVWYNSSLESKNYVVPGLIAVILMIIAALLTSLTIAREWEMGTMEQLLSTPLRPAEMVLGKMFAYFVVGVADAVDRAAGRACSCSTCRCAAACCCWWCRSASSCAARCSGASSFRRRRKIAGAGLPAGNAQFVPAGVPALRIHLLDREHAVGDPGDHVHRSGAVLRRRF